MKNHTVTELALSDFQTLTLEEAREALAQLLVNPEALKLRCEMLQECEQIVKEHHPTPSLPSHFELLEKIPAQGVEDLDHSTVLEVVSNRKLLRRLHAVIWNCSPENGIWPPRIDTCIQQYRATPSDPRGAIPPRTDNINGTEQDPPAALPFNSKPEPPTMGMASGMQPKADPRHRGVSKGQIMSAAVIVILIGSNALVIYQNNQNSQIAQDAEKSLAALKAQKEESDNKAAEAARKNDRLLAELNAAQQRSVSLERKHNSTEEALARLKRLYEERGKLIARATGNLSSQPLDAPGSPLLEGAPPLVQNPETPDGKEQAIPPSPIPDPVFEEGENSNCEPIGPEPCVHQEGALIPSTEGDQG